MEIDFSNIDIKELACFIHEILKNDGIEAILVVAHVFQSIAKTAINHMI